MADAALDQKRIRDAAAGWYARLNNTTISTDLLREFREWRKDDRHAEAYAEIEAFWERAGKLEDDRDIQRAAGEALAKKPEPAARLPRLGKGGVVGAALAVIVGAASVLAWPTIVGRTYRTEIGEQRFVRLEDGSRVRLDTESVIRVKMASKARRIALVSGRAVFDVAHDASRPFTVAAGATSVRAVGTEFEVRRDDGGAEVTLLEGKVQVRGPGAGGQRTWTLVPGDQLAVGDAVRAPQVRRVDTRQATGWAEGRLQFRREPLSAVVAEVNRYTRIKVVLADPALGRLPLTGVFNVGDTEAFVAAVSDLYDLKVENRSDQIRLLPAG